MRRRWFAFCSALLVFVAIGPLAGTPAGAAPVVTVDIEGAASVFHDTATTTYTVTVAGGPVSSLAVSTHQDAALPADDTSVADALVDGSGAPTGSVTRTGPDLSFTLGPRDPGRSTVTFAVTVDPAPPATYRSTATARWTVGDGAPRSLDSAPVLINIGSDEAPPVDLSVDLGGVATIDDPILIGTTGTTDLTAYVSNAGTSASPASLLVAAGAGLVVGEVAILDPNAVQDGPDGDGLTELTCVADRAHPGQQTCPLPAFAVGDDNGLLVDIAVSVSKAAAFGATAALTVTVSPAPDPSVEADPSDNSDQGVFQFTGLADLTYTIVPAQARVTVGHSVSLTVSVANRGPNPTAGVVAFIGLLDLAGHLRLVDFSGTILDGGFGTARMTRSTTLAARRERVRQLAAKRRSPGALADPNEVIWLVGDMAAGQTKTAQLTLRAVSPGHESLTIVAVSAASDPDCTETQPCPPASAELTALAPVVAVVPVAPVVPAPPVIAPNAGPVLANTGAPAGRLSLFAAGLLLAGGALTGAGRRRRYDPVRTSPR